MSSNADAIIAGGKCAICGGWLNLHGEPCTPEEDTQVLIDAALTANDALWRQAIAGAVNDSYLISGSNAESFIDYIETALTRLRGEREGAR